MRVRIRQCWLLALAALVLTACGGGGGTESARQTGSVTLAFSDAPPSAEFAQILMVIREIRFIGPGGQDIVVLSEPREIDFLKLRNFSEVLVRRDVATGTINKIRLILDSLRLVRADGSMESVRLNGLDKIDVNPQGPIVIRAGEDVLIDIEVDLKNSIHIVGTGNDRYRFRPVIFVRASSEPAFDKLFRLAGTIDELFTAESAFSLCDLRRLSEDSQRPNPREICIRVDADDTTRFFDAGAMAGGDFGDLVLNDRVVVYGKFDPNASGDSLRPSVIAIGTDFARVTGVVASAFDSVTESFDLDAETGLCVGPAQVQRVGVADVVPVFIESVVEPDVGVATLGGRGDILACRDAEAEGFRVSDEQLRAFVVMVSDPTP
jgi:hypothetical protein